MKTPSLAAVKNRRDLEDVFRGAMENADRNLRSLWHFEKEQYLPKSYLIEFHPGNLTRPASTQDGIMAALQRCSGRHSANVRPTEDRTLLFLQHQEAAKYSAEFIVDCLNPRFLVFHTLSSVHSTDRFIFDRLTQYEPEFDVFWFPISMLEDLERREKIMGWEALFVPPPSQGNGEVEPNIDVSRKPRLNIKIEREGALQYYRQFRSDPSFLRDVPLESVTAERREESNPVPTRARVKSKGKVTGRGRDFSLYLQIVNGILDDYSELVKRAEERYSIGYSPESSASGPVSLRVRGEPFCITFSQKIDVHFLIRLMFNCKGPFRLMGEPERLDEDYFAVDAIDLHINKPIAFEMTSDFMRIYLYEGTCGNTLVRILRSLQHHVDSHLTHPPLAHPVPA